MFEEEEKTFGGPSWSIDLTSKAGILGGSQLVEGAHLTFGNTRFRHAPNKLRKLLDSQLPSLISLFIFV